MKLGNSNNGGIILSMIIGGALFAGFSVYMAEAQDTIAKIPVANAWWWLCGLGGLVFVCGIGWLIKTNSND